MTVEYIVKSHSDRSRKTALPAADQQRRKHNYKIAEMYVHIGKRDKKHGESYVAKCGKKRYKGNIKYFLMVDFFNNEVPFGKKYCISLW